MRHFAHSFTFLSLHLAFQGTHLVKNSPRIWLILPETTNSCAEMKRVVKCTGNRAFSSERNAVAFGFHNMNQ